jgi:hypothetical protein
MPRVVPSQVVDVIDQVFPNAKDQKDHRDARFSIDKTYQNEMAAIVVLVDQIPSELLRLDPDDYVAFVLAVSAIKQIFHEWKIRNYALEHIHGYGHGHLNPVTILRNALVKCPDEGIEPSTSGLDYISDPDFKKNLQIDISSSNQALRNGEWKAATVLAGSVIEALLLWALQEVQATDPDKINNARIGLTSNPGQNLEKWKLYQLIDVAEEIVVITKDTATQSRLAKDFRNLIHPGRSARKQQICDRGTALSAIAAIEHVDRDLRIFNS